MKRNNQIKNVLFLDDDPAFAVQVEAYLKKSCEKDGDYWNVDYVRTMKELVEIGNSSPLINQYDLLLLDYDLNCDEQGFQYGVDIAQHFDYALRPPIILLTGNESTVIKEEIASINASYISKPNDKEDLKKLKLAIEIQYEELLNKRSLQKALESRKNEMVVALSKEWSLAGHPRKYIENSINDVAKNKGVKVEEVYKILYEAHVLKDSILYNLQKSRERNIARSILKGIGEPEELGNLIVTAIQSIDNVEEIVVSAANKDISE